MKQTDPAFEWRLYHLQKTKIQKANQREESLTPHFYHTAETKNSIREPSIEGGRSWQAIRPCPRQGFLIIGGPTGSVLSVK